MENDVNCSSPKKRKRGRPRKIQEETLLYNKSDVCGLEIDNTNSLQKKKRGRPRKNTEEINHLKSQDNVTVNERLNSNGSDFIDVSQIEVRRSGRAVKVPSRYASYQVEEDDTAEYDDGSELYECDACGRTFHYRSGIYVHQYTCSAEKELSCDLCQETLKSYKDLYTHQKTHQSYSCDFCKQEFKNISEFRIHSRWHTLQTLECSICHRRFLRGKALKEHMVQIHDKPMEMYTCAMCQKTFALLDYLKEHQRTHEGEEGFTMEYIVKPLVKDTAKRNTCFQDKPGKTKKEFVRKVLEPMEWKTTEKNNEQVPLTKNHFPEFMESPRQFEKRVRREINAKKNLVVHVHIQPDEKGGQKIVTSCQTEPVIAASTQQRLQQQEASKDPIYSLPEECVVVLSEAEEAVNDLVRQSADVSAIEITQLESEMQNQQVQHQEQHTFESNKQIIEDSHTLTHSFTRNDFISNGDEVHACEESTLTYQAPPHQQLVVNEEFVNMAPEQHINSVNEIVQVHHGDQTLLQNSQGIVQENQQIYLSDGQTILVEQQNNLEPGQQIYLQTLSETGHVNGQQIIMQGDGPTVFVQEGPDGQQQHVVVQTAEECIAIDGSERHQVIVQDTSDIIQNNQHVILQSGTTPDLQQHVVLQTTEDCITIDGVLQNTGDVVRNSQQGILQSGERQDDQQHVVLQTPEDCVTIDGVLQSTGDIVVNSQQGILQSGERQNDQQQHVVLQTAENCITIDRVAQSDGDTVGNNQHVMQSGERQDEQQHVVLQTPEDCITIDGRGGQHLVVQDSGDVVSNVIMQSGDGTTLLLEGDCSVGDSIIVAAMQNI